eukprot:SAG31_NODE_850_length_11521_cov_47.558396_10_plen_44_part_00
MKIAIAAGDVASLLLRTRIVMIFNTNHGKEKGGGEGVATVRSY